MLFINSILHTHTRHLPNSTHQLRLSLSLESKLKKKKKLSHLVSTPVLFLVLLKLYVCLFSLCIKCRPMPPTGNSYSLQQHQHLLLPWLSPASAPISVFSPAAENILSKIFYSLVSLLLQLIWT